MEAGVALTGTVLSPRIRLTSRPDVPDAEKLSWLVLGEGLENAEGSAQMAALQVAASSLFGANDGGLSGGLRDALGLDVLTVRSAGRDAGLRPSGFGDAARREGVLKLPVDDRSTVRRHCSAPRVHLFADGAGLPPLPVDDGLGAPSRDTVGLPESG